MNGNRRIIEVVAALIRDAEGRYLVGQRAEQKAQGGKWEFMGGKIEVGETPEAALARECLEELALEIENEHIVDSVVHEYPEKTIRLTLIACAPKPGSVPTALEHRQIRWVTREEMSGLDFSPADRELIARFHRPDSCPVTRYDRAPEGYAESVAEWIANPHAYFVSFGAEARAFQKRHPSERLRTMTLVAEAEKLTTFRPVRISLDDSTERVASWEEAFSVATSRLVTACPETFAALQSAGELLWLGCEPGGSPAEAMLAVGSLRSEFGSLAEVVARIQWLFLMCGVKLNEVIVQVDPYEDDAWKVRKAEIDSRRAADKAFMDGRRAAQKAWAERQARGFREPGSDGRLHVVG